MIYNVLMMPRAAKELDGLNPLEREKILSKIRSLAQNLSGDVKKLTNFSPEYRLRVGVYRVLFDVIKNDVVVQRVMHRNKAYR